MQLELPLTYRLPSVCMNEWFRAIEARFVILAKILLSDRILSNSSETVALDRLTPPRLLISSSVPLLLYLLSLSN